MTTVPPMLDARVVLTLGGARSGKSRWAQALAEASGRQSVYIATAEGLDDEMRERILRHRQDRGAAWRTREEPLELVDALREETAADRIVLVDCLTLWLSNLIHAERSPGAEIAALAETLRLLSGPAILVSNEVGLGIAPMTPLGREFRDWQGRLNSEVASVADAVVAMTAGLPRLLKPSTFPQLCFV